VILIDSDMLVLDLRYQADARYADNKRALELQTDAVSLGTTSQALLEQIGTLPK
jgi:hypothetical protein